MPLILLPPATSGMVFKTGGYWQTTCTNLYFVLNQNAALSGGKMRTENGFTLIELLITVVVLGILTAMAVPSFRSTMDRNAVTTTANDLLSSILLARSEAIKREQPVIFSGNAGFTTWQVGADTNGDGTGDDVLLQHNADNHVGIAAINTATITFNTRGRASLTVNSDYFTISKNDATRYVCFSATGRPRVQEGVCQ